MDTLLSGLHTPVRVLICGATGGIGAALVTQLLLHAQVASVVATARGASLSPTLATQLALHPVRLSVVDADITDSDDLAALVQALGAAPLHLVVNATGLLHDGDLRPEKNLSMLDPDSLNRIFAINAFAPILLAQAVLPLMRGKYPAVFASLSARVGSIGDNRLGGWYAYRAAKAAQNQFLKTLSIESRRSHPGLSVQLLHPGTVDSALSRPFQRGVAAEKLFDPARAARQLLAVIATATPENSGRFVAWDGSEIPW